MKAPGIEGSMNPRASVFACVVVLAVSLTEATRVEARIQGAKGRRLEVLGSLMPYKGGTVIVEEPRLVTNMTKRVVMAEGVRAYAHQFLETRLRELGLTVLPWREEYGPVTQLEADGPLLVADATVTFEASLADSRFLLEVYLRDHETGRILARYQGYGRAALRGTWPGVRDDLQEITRVFAWYLADELQVAPPSWHGFDSTPYTRRQRRELTYEMLSTDKNTTVPVARHHRDPPINEQVREDSHDERPHERWHEDPSQAPGLPVQR
jgi:hypothetical protein